MFGSRSRAPRYPEITIRSKSIKHASHSVYVAGWEAHVVDVCEGVLHPVRDGVGGGEAICEDPVVGGGAHVEPVPVTGVSVTSGKLHG